MMEYKRYFTDGSTDPYDLFEYERRSCTIRNAVGETVFEMEGVEVPRQWSQLASDILISKYVRMAGVPESGHETSVRQVVGRVARTIRAEGESVGLFSSAQDAKVFEEELTYILLDQRAAFNSPVWFNCGLWHEYGVTGGGGNWAWDEAKGELVELENNYEKPQCSACFIQSVEDDLMSIFELVKNEARIFKYGSGTGTNFSNLRGYQEYLSGGGTSSGLMSFLEVFDRAAGATKSGGTTRRAAKMVCLDADHPEILNFIEWKRKEEKKAKALIAEGYESDFNGEAYRTISGQNSNNSIRLSDELMRQMERGGEWQTKMRTTGEVVDTFPAADLMDEINQSAWECADPGLQFETTINAWHTCSNTGPIRASNPCSEFMFLDDSACNLASINLLKYMNDDGTYDIERYRHTVRLLITAQDILVDASSYPTREIAKNSHRFRPLGLGYANLGALLMAEGLPYDSDGGRALAAALTALMTGEAYRISAEIADEVETFDDFAENREPMLAVMKKHRAALGEVEAGALTDAILQAAREAWDGAIAEGEAKGYRNAQVSVLAPTGTIGFLMDCDTTGVEPDYSLVKFKKLAGGGFMKIVNNSVERALKKMGYGESERRAILDYVLGTRSLSGRTDINRLALEQKGFAPSDIDAIEQALSSAYSMEQAFAPSVVSHRTLKRLGLDEASGHPGFRLLREVGFTDAQIAEADAVMCGTMTVEGAPGLKDEHLPVFDCANRCGAKSRRMIEPMGHLRMMSAVQPFLSGAISKTVNLPNNTTVEEIGQIHEAAWLMGLKAVALYRDGCKSSQPLSSTQDEKKEDSKAKAAPDQGQLELFPELAQRGAARRKLPQRRGGVTVESRVAGHKVFLRTGEYADGELGEIFIDMHKEGSTFRSLIMCFAIAVSKGLQYGVPLREYVDTFTFTNFEPRGVCDHPNVKMATSVVDYVFRVLGLEYLGRTDLCQVKPEEMVEQDGPRVGQGVPPMPRRIPGSDSVNRASDDDEPLRSDLEELKTGEGLAAGGDEPIDSPRPTASPGASPLDQQMQSFMADAPFCDQCGHITVRNGACYKCMNCGNSMGCS